MAGVVRAMVARLSLRLVVVTDYPDMHPGGLEVAVQSRRQPKGQQEQGDETSDGAHGGTESAEAGIVNATGGGVGERGRWSCCMSGFSR